jgi:hypothetical protein
MELYTISPSLNKNRVFILNKSELEKRFDPFYYIPELLELEKKVLAKQPKKLRYYVQSMASGATPKTTESEKYYAEKENGIPFLRVQNLSPTGVLEFDDCKYINEETHNGMLKRSQVSACDLLVKITGVGRMAVASVVPEGFEGNINQHVCVIKTGSKEVSETLAAFLNTDIGEKLASRRSTGGTRPALDYPALLSIPIIEDKRILEITSKVIEQKQKNEAEADKLLASIDDYLLKELGITLPETPENTLRNRMFTTTFKELSGSRFDPQFYIRKITLNNPIKLSKLVEIKGGKRIPKGQYYSTEQTDYQYLRVSNMKDYGVIDWDNLEYISKDIYEFLEQYKVDKDDVIISIAGTVGKSCFIEKEVGNIILTENCAKLIIKDKSKLLPIYLQILLELSISKRQIELGFIQTTIPKLGFDKIQQILLPTLPPLDKQKEIADNITSIRLQAQHLKDKTKEALAQANKEIENILLN